jgi:glycosyl transferase family 25
MKYYVTHYTPLVERKQNIIRELAYAGITEYEFILSKDRDVLTANELQKFSGITNSEASLFLKHMEVYKTDGLDNKIVVVFEDDAVLCPNFSKRLNACLLQLKNENWDVLFSGECCGLHCDVTPGKIIKATNTSRGTCMYVLNFGVGKRLYEIFNTQSVIRSPIDWWFNFINSEYNLNYFWSEPTLVEQGSDNGLFKSSLR